MGYLKVIEGNTTWVCPKTATYKIICVASGAPDDDLVGNPTSFGEYCTAYGVWPNSKNYNGYTFKSYGEVYNTAGANTDPRTIGYGAGGYCVNCDALLGKLKVSINDIKKDTSVICTVGDSVIKGKYTSNPGVIVVQEIGEISENNMTESDNEKREFTINLYRYNELYQVLKVKEGSLLVLPTLPIYDNDKYTGDKEHKGYALTLGGDKVYNINQAIYPVADMDLYAGYSYKYKGRTTGTGVVGYYGTCSLSVIGGSSQPSDDATVTFTINGVQKASGTYTVNEGDIIDCTVTGSGLSAEITRPAILTNPWRSEL